MSKVEVSTKGIQNRLKSVKPFNAIAEYIWNGFDAHATEISVNYEIDDLGVITKLSISDNGNGIPHKNLESKFKPVLSSEKREQNIQQGLLTHGKNGLGRLTFYHFCQAAKWTTRFSEEDKIYQYDITINRNNLDNYEYSKVIESNQKETGTIVTFENIELSEYQLKTSITSFLSKEFVWFLELKKHLDFYIKINGENLDISFIIKDYAEFDIEIQGYLFDIRFYRWSEKLNKIYSNFYGVDLEGSCKYLKPTTLNNKGDSFHHSVFIHSRFFDSFKCEPLEGQSDCVTSNTDKSEVFKQLITELNSFLQNKRKPFLIEYAKSLVESYEKEGIFPSYNAKNKWEKLRCDDLKETIIQLYLIEPSIFSNLNETQKKTFVGFLALLLDSGEAEHLFKILDGVIDLSSAEREVFAKQLKITKLSSILKTIELISDRYKSVEELKKLVFEPKMYANEVPHLQKMMERNYWLIGEEYQLLTAAEPDFEKALRRFCYILHGENDKKEIEHPDKNREMDIFLIRQDKVHNRIENVVLELKHPHNIKLGKKELDQVYDYYQVIKSEPRFNASNMDWKFFLIGSKFDSKGYIESQIETHKILGEAGLAFKGEYKVYVFRWSEVFAEFELRHNFLNQKLELERDRLIVNEHLSADDIVDNTRTSDSLKEIHVPNNKTFLS